MLFILPASFKNQVDTNQHNQVDNSAEANKKTASFKADSSDFSYDY